jgi:SAM-dependent methyltransferase
VGLPVFKTGGAALGVARWVRLPCAPASRVEVTTVTDANATADETPDWAAYYRHTLGREVRPLFARGLAAARAAGVTAGHAVEIGFGDGTETLALLAAGFHVLAVEASAEAPAVLRSRVSPATEGRLEVVVAPAETVALPPCDFLYSGYVLSFLAPEAFERFWAAARAALRPGGFVVVNVFGDRDTWAGETGMTFIDRATVDRLVAGLEVVEVLEEDKDGDSFSGPKHWHLFDIVARRSPESTA